MNKDEQKKNNGDNDEYLDINGSNDEINIRQNEQKGTQTTFELNVIQFDFSFQRQNKINMEITKEKSFEFASNIVLFYNNYSKTHKDNTISKQLLRSGTRIGVNINEAQYGNSKSDFIPSYIYHLKKLVN